MSNWTAYALAAANATEPQRVTLEVQQRSRAALAIAAGALVLVAVLMAVLKYRLAYRGLPDDQQAHVRQLIGQLEAQTPTTLRWTPDELRELTDTGREEIRDAVGATPGADVQSDRGTVAQAVAEARGAWGEAISDVTESLPVLAVRLVSLGGLVAVLGPIAVYATDRWRAAARDEGGPLLPLDAVLSGLQDLTTAVVNAGSTILLSFPFVDLLWSLGLTYGILLGRWIYQHPLVVAVALVAGGLTVWQLDDRLVSDASTTPRRRTITTSSVVKALLTVWALGVAPTALGALAGAREIGAVVGFLLALAATGGLGAWGAWWTYYDLRRAARMDWPEDADRLVVAYLVGRRVGTILATVGGVLVVAYLGVAVVTGKLVTVLLILWAADTAIQAALGIVVSAVILAAGLRARSALPTFREAVGDLLHSRAWKLAAFGRGLPLAAVVVAYVVADMIVGRALVAAAAAIGVGVSIRLLYLTLRAAKYRASLVESPESERSRVVAHTYEVADADGDSHHLVRLNGTWLGHTDPDALADYTVQAIEDLLDDDTDGIRPSLASHYADHLRELGFTDPNQTEAKLRAELRQRTFGNIDERGGVAADALRDELEEIPDGVARPRLGRIYDDDVPWPGQWEIKGTHEGMLLYDDGYVRLIKS